LTFSGYAHVHHIPLSLYRAFSVQTSTTVRQLLMPAPTASVTTQRPDTSAPVQRDFISAPTANAVSVSFACWCMMTEQLRYGG